jgi:hypothetical protein
MKRFTLSMLAVVLLGAGHGVFGAGKAPVPKGLREGRTVRASVSPVIDGKLDDACWTQAQKITGFRGWTNAYGPGYMLDSGLDAEVAHQSSAQVCYDDKSLYVGVKCLTASADPPANR